MTAILALLSTGLGKAIATGIAVILALAVAYFKGRADKGKAAKAEQAAKELAAAQDRLEMNREATEAEKQAAAMTDKQAYDEAMKWVKR